MPEKILRLAAVKELTGLSRSSVYQKIAAGSFPEPISLGARAVGWLESDVGAWIENKIAASRSARSHLCPAHAGNRASTYSSADRRSPPRSNP